MKYAILLAAVAACAPVARAEMGTWKVPSWQAFLSAPGAVKKVVDGKCPGHSQGMCVTSNAFYFSFKFVRYRFCLSNTLHVFQAKISNIHHKVIF